MHLLFALAILAAPAGAPVPPGAGGATDLTPIYPDGACIALGIDIKAVMNSPLGKKVVGEDKPFDAARKLLKVLIPHLEGLLPVEGDVGKAVAKVANRLNRVTVVATTEGFAIYLEGEIAEDDYIRAAELLAKDSNSAFKTEKLGGRKLVMVGEGRGTVYGVRVSDALFLIAYRKELIDEVLDKHAGKKTASIDKLLAERLKKVKTADTPVWLVSGELKFGDLLSIIN